MIKYINENNNHYGNKRGKKLKIVANNENLPSANRKGSCC